MSDTQATEGAQAFLGDGWRFPSTEQLVYGDLSHHEGPKDTPTGKDRPARENHSTSDEQKFNVAQEPSELRTQGKLSIPARPLPHPGVDRWVERDRTQRLMLHSLQVQVPGEKPARPVFPDSSWLSSEAIFPRSQAWEAPGEWNFMGKRRELGLGLLAPFR